MDEFRYGVRLVRVLAVVRDLFFRVKIEETARQVSQPIEFCLPKDLHEALSANRPDLLIADLEDESESILREVRALNKATPRPKLVGYLSHVRVDLRTAALEAGFDLALPRSAFVSELPQILQGG